MSHSTVLVIGPDVDKQLEPFDENTEVEPYWKTEVSGDIQDYWGTRRFIEEGKLAADATMEQLAELLQKEWGDEDGVYRYNAETQSVEQQSTYNPRSRWDWYTVGGRWRGYYAIKIPTPMRDKHQPVMGRSGAGGNAPRHDADQVLKCQIDFDRMRDEAEREVLRDYEKILDATKHLKGTPESWQKCRARHLGELEDREFSSLNEDERAEFQLGMDKARQAHRTDQWQVAIDNAFDGHYWGDAVSDYFLDQPDGRQKLIDSTRANVGIPFAVLKDGEWYERGRMGWWGAVADEQDRDDWAKRVNGLVDDLPDDTLFTIVDVHI